MMLYLVRHALAEDASASGEDDARRLTDKGREQAGRVGAGMAALGLSPNLILASPLPRAAETARILAEAFTAHPPVRALAELSAGIPPVQAIAAIAPHCRHDEVMVVGHEPQLSAMTALMLCGDSSGMHLRMRKLGCVALDLPVGRIAPRAGELHWMMTRRQLARMR